MLRLISPAHTSDEDGSDVPNANGSPATETGHRQSWAPGNGAWCWRDDCDGWTKYAVNESPAANIIPKQNALASAKLFRK